MAAQKTFKTYIIKQPGVYIMANKRNGTLYTGVTSNLIQRIYQHRTGMINGFTEQYEYKMLGSYELHDTMESAISQETRIKMVPIKRSYN